MRSRKKRVPFSSKDFRIHRKYALLSNFSFHFKSVFQVNLSTMSTEHERTFGNCFVNNAFFLFFPPSDARFLATRIRLDSSRSLKSVQTYQVVKSMSCHDVMKHIFSKNRADLVSSNKHFTSSGAFVISSLACAHR